MIKGYLISLIMFSIGAWSCSGHKEEKPCDKFREGLFSIKEKTNWHDVIITRRDSMQVEIDPRESEISYFKMTWTGDCSYELRFVKKRQHDKNAIDSMERPVLRETILEANDKYYIFETTVGESTFIYKDTMWLSKKVGGFKSIGDVFGYK